MEYHCETPDLSYLNFYQKGLDEVQKIFKLIENEKHPLAKELFKIIAEYHYVRFSLNSCDNKLRAIELKFEIDWAMKRLDYEPIYVDEMQNHLHKTIFLFNLYDEKYQ